MRAHTLSVASTLTVTMVALHGFATTAFAPPIVSLETCDGSPCLSRRRPQTRGNAAAFGTPSTRWQSGSLSFGSVSRSDGSPLVLRSTMPGRNGGRGRGRGRGRSGRGRGGGGGRGRGTIRQSRPNFRDCQNIVELTDLAHANLDSMSNRDTAAFWSALPRLLHQRGGRTDTELESKLRSLTPYGRSAQLCTHLPNASSIPPPEECTIVHSFGQNRCISQTQN